jgi:hypothetical protein
MIVGVDVDASVQSRRLRLAAFAPSLPSAVRVFFGSFEMVFFLFAARAAFLMFFRAADFCLELAIFSSSTDDASPERDHLTLAV